MVSKKIWVQQTDLRGLGAEQDEKLKWNSAGHLIVNGEFLCLSVGCSSASSRVFYWDAFSL